MDVLQTRSAYLRRPCRDNDSAESFPNPAPFAFTTVTRNTPHSPANGTGMGQSPQAQSPLIQGALIPADNASIIVPLVVAAYVILTSAAGLVSPVHDKGAGQDTTPGAPSDFAMSALG